MAQSDRAKGGRSLYDAVLTFKVMVLQMLDTLSDVQAECQIKDHLSFMRVLRLALHDPVHDATTIWLFRRAIGADRSFPIAVRPLRRRAA